MNDLLYKGHFKGLDIAFTYAVTTHAVNQAIVLHDCDPVSAHLMGRAMTGTLMAAAVQAEGNRVNAYWRYRGALKVIIVDAGQDGTVRGFMNPAQLADAGDTVEALFGEMGDLQVVVTRDGKVINSGTTEVPFQDVIQDLAYFYSISDQVESGMAVMIGFQVNEKQPVELCQGWMVQALPGCDLERLDRVRKRMDSEAFRALLQQGSDADLYVEKLANALVSEEADFEGLYMEEVPPPRFECTCSREKMGAVLMSLSVNDRMAMVKKGENVAVSCQFCNKRYELTIPECINVWNKKPLDAPADEV